MSPVDLVSLLAEVGAWGVNLHDNDLVPIDAIVGESTLRELIRYESRHADPELVSSVRERALLRDAGPTLAGRHVAIGENGGLGSVTGAMRRRLVLAAAAAACRP